MKQGVQLAGNMEASYIYMFACHQLDESMQTNCECASLTPPITDSYNVNVLCCCMNTLTAALSAAAVRSLSNPVLQLGSLWIPDFGEPGQFKPLGPR